MATKFNTIVVTPNAPGLPGGVAGIDANGTDIGDFVIGSETVTYVRQASDWGPIVTVDGKDYYMLSSGQYIVCGKVESENAGLTFEDGSSVVIRGANPLNSMAGYDSTGNERCPIIALGGNDTGPFIFANNDYKPKYLQIKGVAFKDTSGFISNGVFDMEVTSASLRVILDNIYTGLNTPEVSSLGLFNFGNFNSSITIKNSNLIFNPIATALTLNNVAHASIINNYGGFVSAGSAHNFFSVFGSNTRHHSYINNFIVDNNGSNVCPIFAINTDISGVAKMVISNHYIGEGASISYFNSSNINQTDVRIKLYGNYRIDDN